MINLFNSNSVLSMALAASAAIATTTATAGERLIYDCTYQTKLLQTLRIYTDYDTGASTAELDLAGEVYKFAIVYHGYPIGMASTNDTLYIGRSSDGRQMIEATLPHIMPQGIGRGMIRRGDNMGYRFEAAAPLQFGKFTENTIICRS